MNSPDPAAVAALIAGLITKGMDHDMSASVIQDVLEVLEDARIAVVPLPPIEGERVTATGVCRAWFGPIEACICPKGGWVISDLTGHWDGDEEDDAERAAAGIIAARRWVQRGTGP
jgi:hypothetical protein